MQAAIDTRQPRLVEAEIRSAYLAMFPDADQDFVRTIFQWATACFEGRYEDYQPIDAHYHDWNTRCRGPCACRGCSGTGTAPARNRA